MNVAPVKPGDPVHDAACEALGVPTPAALAALAAEINCAVREILDAGPAGRKVHAGIARILEVSAELQAVAPQEAPPATTAEQQVILDLDRRVAAVEAQLDTLARIARAMQAADEGADSERAAFNGGGSE